jgi:hypothetical protein
MNLKKLVSCFSILMLMLSASVEAQTTSTAIWLGGEDTVVQKDKRKTQPPTSQLSRTGQCTFPAPSASTSDSAI